jgi:photosystem II stability/assembly factor-like uncharacterized protein
VNTIKDLRQALSEEMSRLQPPAGLETRVLQQALRSAAAVPLDRSRKSPVVPMGRRTELAAGIAAVVLAAIVIGTFAYIRAATRPHTVAPPITSRAMQVLPQVMAGNVGWADGPQRTTDGALHWRDVSPPAPANRTKGAETNYFLDGYHAWVTVATGAVALQNATALVVFSTADGGQTWSQGRVPISGFGFDTASLDFIDPQRGWLITDSGRQTLDTKSPSGIGTQPLTRAVYASNDGGLTWTKLADATEADGSTLGTLAPGCSPSGLTFTSLNDGWLTWDCSNGIGSPRSEPAVTHDGGRSWQPVPLPSFPSGSNYFCSTYPPVFTVSQAVLPVNCGGSVLGVYATSDAGRSWSFRTLPFSSQQLDFVDANAGWTFGGTGVSLYRTSDGGQDWVVVKQFASEQYAGGVAFVDPATGFALTVRYAPDGNSGYRTMWKTTDGGQTWSVMSSVATGPAGPGFRRPSP